MSKKMPEHKRLFKQYKAGFFDKIPMTEEQENILRKHYPFLFVETGVIKTCHMN